jgi:two-component system, OmpR family, phosphate regulon sensor histidine kinase PhoR
VYNHPAAMARPMLWGAIHAGFVSLLVVVLLVHWRISEDEQQATSRIRDRLSLVIGTSHDAILQVDDDGIVTSANESAAQMMGLAAAADAVGIPAASVIDPLPIHDAATSRVRAVVTSAGGTSTPVDLTVTTTEVAGVVTHAVFARDMSDIDRAMRRMEDAVRAKDELIASVSHEIRTPLTGILGLSAEVARDPAAFSPQELTLLLTTVTEEAQEMADLIEDLLTSARARIGTLSVMPSDVDLGDVIGAVLRSASLATVAAHVSLEANASAHVDPLRIRQIVRNLLTNAQRYGGGRIGIATRTEGRWAYVEVSDEGDALAPVVVENMFRPYFTGATGATQPRAIGLGLAVSADLARAMGGELGFVRRDERNCFVLRVPVAVERVRAVPAMVV